MKLAGVRYNDQARQYHCVEFLIDEYEKLTEVNFGDNGMQREMSAKAKEWLDKQAPGWFVSFAPRFRKMVASVWVPSQSSAVMFKVTFG